MTNGSSLPLINENDLLETIYIRCNVQKQWETRLQFFALKTSIIKPDNNNYHFTEI